MNRLLVILIFIAGCSETNSTESVQPSSWFEDQAIQRGVDFVWESGAGKFPYNPEIIAGGVALLDVDGDKDLDIYFVQGGSVLEGSQNLFPNQLYLNDGTGHFVNGTEGSGAGDTAFGTGVATGDYDNDGDVDLYVTNVNGDVLLQNDGHGKFNDVTNQSGIQNNRWGASAAFFDMENDGDLDLFVTNYIDWAPEIELECTTRAGVLDYCHPQAYQAPAKDILFRNNGDGTFEDVSISSGIHSVWGNGLGVSIGDVNEDGFEDIFVANDKMNNQLWMNQGDGSFIDEAVIAGVAVDANGEPKAGMGTDIADVNNDGLLDILVVNLYGETDSLFLNEGGWFRDGTPQSGLSTVSRPFTRFGTGFRDFDNDGYLDIYMANGKVRMPDAPEDGDPYAERNVLVRGMPNGRFKEVLPNGGVEPDLNHTSRGAALGDLNGDGFVDIVVVNRDEQAYVLMNQNNDSRFVTIRLYNHFGAPAQGAVVRYMHENQQKRRESSSRGGYCSAHDATVIIGLGNASGVTDIEVAWSNGNT